MRRLVCIVAAIGILALAVGAVIDRLPERQTASDERSGESPQPAIAAPAPDDGTKGTITVEGEGLSPWEKKALAEGFRKMLSDAVHEAIKRGIEDLERKLELADDMERKLLAAAFNWGEPDADGPVILMICLIRPRKADVRRGPSR
jgi:hypothetical protein